MKVSILDVLSLRVSVEGGGPWRVGEGKDVLGGGGGY